MRPRYITIRLAISTCLCMIAVLGCLLSLFYKGTPTALRTPGAAFCGLSSLFIIYRIICLSHKRSIFRRCLSLPRPWPDIRCWFRGTILWYTGSKRFRICREYTGKCWFWCRCFGKTRGYNLRDPVQTLWLPGWYWCCTTGLCRACILRMPCRNGTYQPIFYPKRTQAGR